MNTHFHTAAPKNSQSAYTLLSTVLVFRPRFSITSIVVSYPFFTLNDIVYIEALESHLQYCLPQEAFPHSPEIKSPVCTHITLDMPSLKSFLYYKVFFSLHVYRITTLPFGSPFASSRVVSL